MNITDKIFLRSDQVNVDGTNNVYLRLTVNRRVKNYSLKIRVNKKDWDSRTCRVKNSDTEFLRKNKYIVKYINRARNIIDDHILNDKILTFSVFKKLFKTNYNKQTCFYTLAEVEMQNNNFEPATIKSYNVVLGKLKEFRKELDVREIDTDFIKSFKKHLIEKHGNKPSTADKNLRIIKRFITVALDKELIKKNPFDKVKLKHAVGDNEILTENEIVKLSNLLDTNKLSNSENETLRHFLFSCYTGLRFSDIKELSHKHIKNDTVAKTMHKTKKLVTIPLTQKAKNLIKPTKILNQKVFKVSASQTVNKRLKKLMRIASIDKYITYHNSRHTFAIQARHT